MIKKILLITSALTLSNYVSVYATDSKEVIDQNKVEETKLDGSEKVLDSDKKNVSIYKKDRIVAEEEYDIESDGSFPGLYLDWGVNCPTKNNNVDLKNTFFGSRFFDITLCYNLVIPDSHFAVCVGMGYSAKTLSFEGKEIGQGEKKDMQYHTLISDGSKDSAVKVQDSREYLGTKNKIDSVSGSYLNLHFYNFIMDLKFFVDKMYPKDSFIFSVGMKIGILMSANTEIEYRQNACLKSQTITDKSKLKELAWGFQSRAAWGRFGLVYEIILSDLYSKNYAFNIGYLQKFGISIDLF